MAFELLPDWQDPLTDGVVVLRPWSAQGRFAVLPSALELDGSSGPGMALEFVRGTNPNLPPEPYGVLELNLRLGYEMERALEVARLQAPDATASRAPIADGWLRLEPMGEAEIPDDLRVPVPLATGGLEGLVWVLKVSADTASLLKGALEEEVLALRARAEIEVEGIAPRIDARASFVPGALVGAAMSVAGGQGSVAHPDLLSLFTTELPNLPVELHGLERDETERLGARLTDLVWSRYGRIVAEPDGAGVLHAALDQVLPEERIEVDLSLPEPVSRPLQFTFDPLEPARTHVAAAGVESLMRYSEIPSFDAGLRAVEIYANVPRDRRGVLAMGVDLLAPANPPDRVHPVAASVELAADGAPVTTTMRLAPGETPQLSVTPYAIVRDEGGIERLEGEPFETVEPHIELDVGHWPLAFAQLGVSGSLLVHGSVVFSVSYTLDGAPGAVEFTPTPVALGTAVCVSASASDVTVSATLTNSEGDVVTVGPEPFADMRLDLASFPAFGPQTVSVSCEFGDDMTTFAVDLLPAGLPDAPDSITVMLLTRDEPAKEWRFLSPSPFGAAFRYRANAGPDATPGPWSELIPAANGLTLSSGVPA